MSDDQKRKRIEKAIALCREAQDQLDGNSVFRTRVLLSMLLADLSKELDACKGTLGGAHA